MKVLTKKYLNEFYQNCTKNDIRGFYYRSRLHSVIVLEIALSTFEKNNMVSFEYLCEGIPKIIGKRTTIQTILNDGIRKGYFIKNLNPNDKRIKYYNLDIMSQSIMENWWKLHDDRVIL